MPDYIDLLITDDDFTLDAGRIPQMVDGRASIAQDIVHMIRETGLLVALVANRDARRKEQNLLQISSATCKTRSPWRSWLAGLTPAR